MGKRFRKNAVYVGEQDHSKFWKRYWKRWNKRRQIAQDMIDARQDKTVLVMI